MTDHWAERERERGREADREQRGRSSPGPVLARPPPPPSGCTCFSAVHQVFGGERGGGFPFPPSFPSSCFPSSPTEVVSPAPSALSFLSIFFNPPLPPRRALFPLLRLSLTRVSRVWLCGSVVPAFPMPLSPVAWFPRCRRGCRRRTRRRGPRPPPLLLSPPPPTSPFLSSAAAADS